VLNERGETLGDVIRARRKRLIEEFGGTFEDLPEGSFAGARSIAEIILRSRQIYCESACSTSASGARG
jgi:phosphoenolpyruvate synthase/pyruvate phosphate dikinase